MSAGCQRLLTLLVSVQARGGGVLQLNERGIRLQVKGEQDRIRRLELAVTEVALRILRNDATKADELRRNTLQARMSQLDAEVREEIRNERINRPSTAPEGGRGSSRKLQSSQGLDCLGCFLLTNETTTTTTMILTNLRSISFGHPSLSLWTCY